jgi:hypothetical protein
MGQLMNDRLVNQKPNRAMQRAMKRGHVPNNAVRTPRKKT